jgi:hypothetical protein
MMQIIANVVGWEVFRWPSGTVWGMLCLMVLFSFAFNYALNFGISLTSPLFMRIVLACGVPVSFVLNAIAYGFGDLFWLRASGASAILAGFSLFLVAYWNDEKAAAPPPTSTPPRQRNVSDVARNVL